MDPRNSSRSNSSFVKTKPNSAGSKARPSFLVSGAVGDSGIDSVHELGLFGGAAFALEMPDFFDGVQHGALQASGVELQVADLSFAFGIAVSED